MKKGMLVLLVAAIALVSFRKKDNTVNTLMSATVNVTNWSLKNIKENSLTATADTIKKGGGRRNNDIPYRGTGPVTGGGGKEGQGGNGGAGKEDAGGKGGNGKNKTGGAAGDAKEGAGEKGGKVTSNPRAAAAKEGAGGKGGKVTSDPGTGGNGKTEVAVSHRQ